jgi:hypothetical protein
MSVKKEFLMSLESGSKKITNSGIEHFNLFNQLVNKQKQIVESEELKESSLAIAILRANENLIPIKPLSQHQFKNGSLEHHFYFYTLNYLRKKLARYSIAFIKILHDSKKFKTYQHLLNFIFETKISNQRLFFHLNKLLYFLKFINESKKKRRELTEKQIHLLSQPLLIQGPFDREKIDKYFQAHPQHAEELGDLNTYISNIRMEFNNFYEQWELSSRNCLISLEKSYHEGVNYLTKKPKTKFQKLTEKKVLAIESKNKRVSAKSTQKVLALFEPRKLSASNFLNLNSLNSFQVNNSPNSSEILQEQAPEINPTEKMDIVGDKNGMASLTEMQELIKSYNEKIEKVLSNETFYSNPESPQILLNLEKMLAKIENGCKENSSLCPLKDFNEMNSKFNFLIIKTDQKILAKSSSFEDTLDRIKDLATLPKNATYQTLSNIEYFNPVVTHVEIASFFDKFIKLWNYQGISIHMKKDEIYEQKRDIMFTALFFRKKEEITKEETVLVRLKKFVAHFPNLKNRLSIPYKTPQEHLAALDLPYKKWGYAGFELGDVEKDFFQNKGHSDFGCYLLLFHKKKETETKVSQQRKSTC